MEKKFIGLDWDSVSSGQTLVYSANTWVSSDELIILNSIVKTDGINTVTIGNSDDIYLSGKTYTNMLNLTGLTTQTGDTLLYIDNNGDVTKGELKSHTHLVSEITNLTLQDIALLSVSNEAELISAVTNINANYMSGTILFENSISLSNDLVINLNAITIDMNGFTLFQNGNIIDIYGQRWNLINGSLKYDNTAWNNIVVHNNLGIKIEGGSGTTITYTIIGKFNNIRFENYIGVSGDTISISGDTNIEMPIYTGSDYAMSLVFDSCSFYSPTGNYDGVPEGSPQITFVPFVVKFGAANNGCSLSVYNHKTPYQQSGNYSKMIKFNVTADTDKIYYYSDSTIELANIEGTGIGEWTLDPSAALSNGQIAKMSNGTAAFITDRHVLPSGKTDTTILVSSSGYLYKQNLDSLNYISLTGGTVTGNLILSGSTSGLVMNNITITGITEDLLTSATENQFATAKSIKTYNDDNITVYLSNFIPTFGYDFGIYSPKLNSQHYQRTISLGYNAGSGSTGSHDNIFMGYFAGYESLSTTNSIFIGDEAGYTSSGISSSIFIGEYAGKISNSDNSVMIGSGAGSFSETSNSTIIGSGAGNLAKNSNNSTFIGSGAGSNIYNSNNSTFIGSVAGNGANNASYSTFIGNAAGQTTTNSSHAIYIGDYAGYNDTVDNNSTSGYSILIGTHINTGGYSNSICIGSGITNSRANEFKIGPINYVNISGLTSIDSTELSGNSLMYYNDNGDISKGYNPVIYSWEETISGITTVGTIFKGGFFTAEYLIDIATNTGITTTIEAFPGLNGGFVHFDSVENILIDGSIGSSQGMSYAFNKFYNNVTLFNSNLIGSISGQGYIIETTADDANTYISSGNFLPDISDESGLTFTYIGGSGIPDGNTKISVTTLGTIRGISF